MSGSFQFSTKAGTLAALAGIITQAEFSDQITIPSGAWRADRENIVASVLARFGERRLAVRSSATSEDTETSSMAGAHLSLIDVLPEADALEQAINDVLASYRTADGDDEVLIQPMVEDTSVAGVVLTRDLDTGAPYYVINYDDFSGRTDTVTGGAESKVVLVHRTRPEALRSPRFRKLIEVVREIEQKTGKEDLDIEFCIDSDDRIFILQARPLAARSQWAEQIDSSIDEAIDEVRRRLSDSGQCLANVVGTRQPIFGEMPDWNPAEMIGSAPRPLAYSLYRFLITDRIWSRARAEMGYRDVPHPLMTAFAGRPYIDTRLSFNSFIPAAIDNDLAGRMVDHQLERLAANRDLHDKIEFDIAVTVLDLSVSEQYDALSEAGFTAGEIQRLNRALKDLTQNILDDDLDTHLALTEQLAAATASWGVASNRVPAEYVIDIQARGTLSFSKLARHGFVAMSMLRSLVKQSVFTQRESDGFMRGIPTVASKLVGDLRHAADGKVSLPYLEEQYGHLRPGAYDIRSERYDQRPELYLNWNTGAGETEPALELFHPSDGQLMAIDRLLADAGYEYDAARLLDYIARAVQSREWAKFNFMKAVSALLEMIAEWGATQDLTRDDLSYLSIEAIIENRSTLDLRDEIDAGRRAHSVTRAIRLPHLIAEASDIDVIRLPLGRPNFITGLSVAGSPLVLSGDTSADIGGKIVLIESADPGFDWIFAHSIAGLITKYGGANSHMAIRSAEFGLPAAIGCGTRLFDLLAHATAIELDCAARIVRPVGERGQA